MAGNLLLTVSSIKTQERSICVATTKEIVVEGNVFHNHKLSSIHRQAPDSHSCGGNGPYTQWLWQQEDWGLCFNSMSHLSSCSSCVRIPGHPFLLLGRTRFLPVKLKSFSVRPCLCLVSLTLFMWVMNLAYLSGQGHAWKKHCFDIHYITESVSKMTK